jgi:hypothetical protein
MAIKDFSILLEPINTITTKKDIGMVSGYNAIVQYMETVMKTQKGELISNMDLCSDYFNYSFGTDDKAVLELNLASYIEAAMVQIRNVKVRLIYYSQDRLQFEVNFSLLNGIKIQNNISCFIEVET